MLSKDHENQPYKGYTPNFTDGTSALSPDQEAFEQKHIVPPEKETDHFKGNTVLSVAMVNDEGKLTVLPFEEESEAGSDHTPENEAPSLMDICFPAKETAQRKPIHEVSYTVSRNDKNGIYVSKGQEYIQSEDNSETGSKQEYPSPSEGIVYDVAEELYRREKIAARLQSLCRPPFKKIFDQEMLMRLDRQADEKTKQLLTAPSKQKTGSERPISTISAVGLLLLMMLPLLNLPAILWFSFSKNSNQNVKAFSRAYLFWSALLIAAAAVYFAVSYFCVPLQENGLIRLAASLFRS